MLLLCGVCKETAHREIVATDDQGEFQFPAQPPQGPVLLYHFDSSSGEARWFILGRRRCDKPLNWRTVIWAGWEMRLYTLNPMWKCAREDHSRSRWHQMGLLLVFSQVVPSGFARIVQKPKESPRLFGSTPISLHIYPFYFHCKQIIKNFHRWNFPILHAIVRLCCDHFSMKRTTSCSNMTHNIVKFFFFQRIPLCCLLFSKYFAICPSFDLHIITICSPYYIPIPPTNCRRPSNQSAYT